MEESYSYTTTNSASSSSSYSNSCADRFSSQEEKSGKPPPPNRFLLHSVRKNVIVKKPIAPMPPKPPKVYKVDPVDFRDVVQKLTGTPDFLPTRLQEVAPPPLSLSPPQPSGCFVGEKPRKQIDCSFGGVSPLGFSLSPSSLAWCSSILLSPGTLSPLEPSSVL